MLKQRVYAVVATSHFSCIAINTDALGAVSLDLGSEWVKAGLVKAGVPMEVRSTTRGRSADVKHNFLN